MENERKATPRQLAYIQHLRKRQGKESMEIEGDIGFEEASQIISNLMGVPLRNSHSRPPKINEARLGMAMKECYKLWRRNGWQILTEHRQKFKEDVTKTYQLFTEIAQELEQQNQVSEA